MQVVFLNECKSCEIMNEIFLNVFIFENKRQTGYDISVMT